MPGSMRRFSGTLENPPPRRDATDRRHSNASETSLPDTSHVRQLSQENTEYIPTRITKVAAPKPAANPLQFIKVGPASLYKSAQEQLKKVEEIKKVTKEVQDEAEDWQSNLDNWKSSRRKRQEHIIERVVEVKKFEMEDYDRNRRRSKTFSEMMEERNSRGRKANLVLYTDDDANDLSDLGIGASGKSDTNEEFEHDVYQKDEEGDTERCLHVNHNGKQGKNGHCDDDGSSVTTLSSPEPEEYTYERAIQGYVNFAETRVKSRAPVTSNLNNSRNQLEKSNTSELGTAKLSNGHSAKDMSSPPHTPRRQKIEEKLSALEKRKNSSTELNNIVNNNKEIPVAKGDVLKRREMFERACDLSEQISKPARRLSEGNQERLSHSEYRGEATSVKEKASQMSSENFNRKDSALLRHRFSNGDVSPAVSVQERLSQLEKRGEEKDQVPDDLSHSVKKRLSNMDSAYGKGDTRNFTPGRDSTLQTKLANFSTEENVLNGIGGIKGLGVGSVRSSSLEDDVLYETKRQQCHRSLDSLDVEGSDDVCNDTFGRVQSLEDLDCCSHARNYPASASSTEMLVFSSQSGDTDRDDSGIHTADVSCSVSQADEPVDDGEIVAAMNSVVPHLETSNSGMDVYHLEVEFVNEKHVGSTVIDEKLLVPEPSDNVTVEPIDIATAFLDVGDNLGSPPMFIAEISTPQTPETRNNSESTSVKDRRQTVVEVCEKIIFDGHGKIGAVKSPPPTPYIEVPNTRVVPVQEPEQLKQETMLLSDRVESEEHVYIESYSIQQAPSDTSVLNVNVESITQEENNVFKGCNNVQQLPSSEKFAQYVPSDMKEEEKSLPVLTSLPTDDTEDVFLPLSPIQQIPPLNMSSDVEIMSGLLFPLGPPTSTEPPKEKPPPPPPAEVSDDELSPVTNLKRVDSTKRIKKELRRKRSDFLGIEGGNDDSYLEPELKVVPPPDMTTFLVEERRSEQQLYRQSICSETDSNHGETTESRDSGVELDRAHSDDWPGKLTPQVLSAQHSRQNSDIYGTASITSEEDEIRKKEREILEILEKEEQWNVSSNTNSGGRGIGEKLAVKLHQMEQENMRLERERSEEENKRKMKENACHEEDVRLRAKEQELKQQESLVASPKKRASVTGKEERVTSASGVRVISKLKIPALFAEK